MESVIEVLMNRDGFTREEAEKEYKCGMELVMEDIAQGDFEIAQQDFEESFGLESDYLMQCIA